MVRQRIEPKGVEAVAGGLRTIISSSTLATPATAAAPGGRTHDPMRAEALVTGAVVAALGVGLCSDTRRRPVLVAGAIGVVAARTIYVATDYVRWQRRLGPVGSPGPMHCSVTKPFI